MQVRCPHCHIPVELQSDSSFDDILCSNCGSTFSLISTTDVTESAHLANKTIGRFALVEQLGIGSFGTVWKARDTQLDRTVAIKIPRKGELSTVETEQFLREARAAAQLRHPNIVSVHEIGKAEDTVYIVSDFVEGANLREWMRGQPLPPREAGQLCAQIALALEYAHQQGVIHRDLKPSNIMMDLEGRPHIMDFGLAKRETGETTMTIEGAILGTPAYMSPEQAKGKGHQADGRSDVYSLGTVLFETLTGELPFRGEKRMLLVQIQTEDAPSPRRLNSRISKDLETICLRCLEKEPAHRFQSAGDLAEDLQCYLAGVPVKARPVGGVTRLWRLCRRFPAVAALLTLLLTTLLATSIIATMVAIHVSQISASERRHKEVAMERLRESLEQGASLETLTRSAGWRKRTMNRVREAAEIRGSPTLRAVAATALLNSDLALQESVGLPKELLRERGAVMNSLAPGGERMFVARGDQLTMLEWSTHTWKPLITQRPAPISLLLVSDDGRSLAASRNDGVVEVWSPDIGKLLCSFDGRGTQAITFGPGENTITTTDGWSLLGWDFVEDRLLFHHPMGLPQKGGAVSEPPRSMHTAQLVSVNGDTIVFASDFHSPVAWRLRDGKLLARPDMKLARGRNLRLTVNPLKQILVVLGNAPSVGGRFRPGGPVRAPGGPAPVPPAPVVDPSASNRPRGPGRPLRVEATTRRLRQPLHVFVGAQEVAPQQPLDIVQPLDVVQPFDTSADTSSIEFERFLAAEVAESLALPSASTDTVNAAEARTLSASDAGAIRNPADNASLAAGFMMPFDWSRWERGTETTFQIGEISTVNRTMSADTLTVVAESGLVMSARLGETIMPFDVKQLPITGTKTLSASGRDVVVAGNDEIRRYAYRGLEMATVETTRQRPRVLISEARKWRCVCTTSDSKLTAAVQGSRVVVWRGFEVVLDTELSEPADMRSAVFDAEGNSLAAGSKDGTVHVWDTKNWRSQRIDQSAVTPIVLQFNAAGNRLAMGGPGGVVVWDLINSRRLSGFKYDRLISAIAFSHDEEVLGIAAHDPRRGNQLHVLDLATEKELVQWAPAKADLISRLSFTTDSTGLVSGNSRQQTTWHLARLRKELMKLGLAW